MLRTLFLLTILAGALTDSALAQAPDAGCALPTEAGGWRVTGIMVQAESAAAPLPKKYLP